MQKEGHKVSLPQYHHSGITVVTRQATQRERERERERERKRERAKIKRETENREREKKRELRVFFYLVPG